MKEVIAIVRLNMVNRTKEALADAGFPAFSCRKVMGRGKKSVNVTLIQEFVNTGEMPATAYAEDLTEIQRLIPKRIFTIIVKDDEVEKIVSTIMETNSTGNPGDGKIFVMPLSESYRIRDGEKDADSY